MAFDTTNYKQLPWIKSTGSQYVLTDIPFISPTKVEIDCEFHAVPTSYASLTSGAIHMGARTSTGGSTNVLLVPLQSTTATQGTMFGPAYASNWIMNNSSYRSTLGYAYSLNTRYKITSILDKRESSGGQGIYNIVDDGTTVTTKGPLNAFTSSYNVSNKTLAVFGIYDWNNSSATPGPSMTLYGLKRYGYNNGWVLTHEYVPALRRSDKVAGLYDVTNEVFKAGVGDFVYPSTQSIWVKANTPTITVSDLTDTEWNFGNSTVQLPSEMITYRINYESGGESWNFFDMRSARITFRYYTETPWVARAVDVYSSPTYSWRSNYRTIKITGGDDVTNADLISWLVANAESMNRWVKGTPYVKVNGTWKEGVAYVKVNGSWKEGK